MKIVDRIIDFLLSLRPVDVVYIKLETTDDRELRVLDELKRYFSQPDHDNTVTQHSRYIPLQSWEVLARMGTIHRIGCGEECGISHSFTRISVAST